MREWWERNFLVIEFITAVVIFLAVLAWSLFINKGVAISQIVSGNRQWIYATLTTLFGTLLGFIITAVSIVLGYAQSDKLTIVRQSNHYKDLWGIFKSTIWILGFATVVALLGLIFDKETNPQYIFIYLNILAIILAVFRIGRCIWVLQNIIAIVTKS